MIERKTGHVKERTTTETQHGSIMKRTMEICEAFESQARMCKSWKGKISVPGLELTLPLGTELRRQSANVIYLEI